MGVRASKIVWVRPIFESNLHASHYSIVFTLSRTGRVRNQKMMVSQHKNYVNAFIQCSHKVKYPSFIPLYKESPYGISHSIPFTTTNCTPAEPAKKKEERKGKSVPKM